jgi:hypothetical protein
VRHRNHCLGLRRGRAATPARTRLRRALAGATAAEQARATAAEPVQQQKCASNAAHENRPNTSRPQIRSPPVLIFSPPARVWPPAKLSPPPRSHMLLPSARHSTAPSRSSRSNLVEDRSGHRSSMDSCSFEVELGAARGRDQGRKGEMAVRPRHRSPSTCTGFRRGAPAAARSRNGAREAGCRQRDFSQSCPSQSRLCSHPDACKPAVDDRPTWWTPTPTGISHALSLCSFAFSLLSLFLLS